MLDLEKIEQEIAKYKAVYPYLFGDDQRITSVTDLVQYLEPMIEEIKGHRATIKLFDSNCRPG